MELSNSNDFRVSRDNSPPTLKAQSSGIGKPDPNIQILGATSIPFEEFSPNGKKMVHYYPLERITLKTPSGIPFHVYEHTLRPLLEDWKKEKKDGERFDVYLTRKMTEDKSFQANFLKRRVKYFDKTDRERTKISFDANGRPIQLGLGTDATFPQILRPGYYMFGLSAKHLYFAPGFVPNVGRIHHSSFLKGAPLRSVGTMIIDKNGYISKVNDLSGHYRPGRKEIIEIVSYLEERLPKADFQKIEVSVKLRMSFWEKVNLGIKPTAYRLEKPADQITGYISDTAIKRAQTAIKRAHKDLLTTINVMTALAFLAAAAVLISYPVHNLDLENLMQIVVPVAAFGTIGVLGSIIAAKRLKALHHNAAFDQ